MHLIASNGKYLTAESGGGLNGDPDRGPVSIQPLVADRTDADLAEFGDAWQAFALVQNADGTVSLKIGQWFVTAERGGGSFVSTDRTVNEAWQRFTLIDLGDGKSAFRCVDGEHYLRLTTLQSVDAGGTSASGAAIAFTGVPVQTMPVLRISRKDFVDEKGSRIVLCGMDQFAALRDFAQGKDLTPLMNESRELGFGMWRVFFMGSEKQNGLLQLDPRAVYDAMRPFADLLNRNGIVLLATVNADAQDIMPSASDRKANWLKIASLLAGSATLLSGGNEWSKNGWNPSELADVPGMLWSRGSDVGDQPPPKPTATFMEFHPRRDLPAALMDTVASPVFLYGQGGFPAIPLIIDEPPRMGTDGSSAEYADSFLCYKFARHYATECAGAVFHSRAGQAGTLMDATTRVCAQAWVRGMRLG
jgi:hypothetical protein